MTYMSHYVVILRGNGLLHEVRKITHYTITCQFDKPSTYTSPGVMEVGDYKVIMTYCVLRRQRVFF